MSLIPQPTCSVHDVSDYIIRKCRLGGVSLNILKLQKLLYYSQAWHLAFGRGRLFNDTFQAWVHGPVNRTIYDRFSDTKTLYSIVDDSDIRSSFNPESMDTAAKQHIDNVLDVYARYSGTDLEILTHSEQPWTLARGGISELERCDTEIDDAVMASYYRAKLQHQ